MTAPVAVQSRQLVRAQPYGTQNEFSALVIANGDTVVYDYDIATVITDRNQLLVTAPNALPSVGPYLDLQVLMSGIGTVDIITIPTGFSMITGPLAVAADTPFIISMLRVPASFVSVYIRNTSGGNVTVSGGVYIRSN